MKHTRAGTGLRLDYKLSEDSTVYFNTMFSHYQDGLNRRWGRFSGVNLNNVFDHFNAAGSPRTATNAAATVLPGWTDTITETINGRFDYVQNHRTRTVRTVNLQAGGKRKFDSADLDYNVSLSRSHGTDDRLIPTGTVSGVGFRFDRDTPGSNALASYEQISGPAIYEIGNRTFDLDTADDEKTDRLFGAQINFRRNFATTRPMYLKTGLRARSQDIVQRFGRGFYTYGGPDGVAGRNPATGANDDNLARFVDHGYDYRSYDGFYPPAPFFHVPTLESELVAAPQNFVPDEVNTLQQALRNNIKAEEQVYAGYIMGGAQLGRLNILTGVRLEETHVKGQGTVQVITDEERALRAAWSGPLTTEERLRRTRAEYGNPRTATAKYRDVFPSIHFRYEFTDGLIGRASYSTGIGRPPFVTIIPNDRINDEAETATINNTALEPQYSDSYDLGLEYYFKGLGLLSAGVFQKDLSSFIFTTDVGFIDAGPDNGFGGDYAGYMLRTQVNGGSARVRGLEVAYQQQFSNLPGFWKGFGIFANFTRLQTEGDYGDIGTNSGPADLVGFVPKSGNLGLTYNAMPWSIRAQVNYTGSQLFRFNATLANRQYEYSKSPVDLSVKYTFSPRFSVYLDVINVFRSPIQRRFQYVSSREMGHDRYSPSIKAGISGRF